MRRIRDLKEANQDYYLLEPHELKEKIISLYVDFPFEKELLQKLLSAEFDLQKATEERKLSYHIQKERDTIYNQLKEKIGEKKEEELKKVNILLDHYEELVQYL